MKFRIWHDKGTEEFEADHMLAKEGAITATRGTQVVAIISVQNVYSVVEVK